MSQVQPGDLVLDIGAGAGVLSLALASRGAEVLAIESDPHWAAHLRREARREFAGKIRVVEGEFAQVELPSRPFRVLASLPFNATTDILTRLLRDPEVPLQRADLIVQWEVARKRSATPPTTLVSAQWAPWWDFALGPKVPREQFRPVPNVDGGVLTILRRTPPILSVCAAPAFARFVRSEWPFGGE